MPINVQTEYPSVSSFSGTSQLNIGPFFISSVGKLLRHEVRGQLNAQGQTISGTSVSANTALWAVQWVPHGNSPSNIISTVDGPQFPIREQLGTTDKDLTWAPTTGGADTLGSWGLRSFWAGQLVINQSIDLYLCVNTPTGIGLANCNLFASLRTWWA